jgi:hypothetical protein
MNGMRVSATVLSLVLVLGAGAACDKVSPVAPTGTTLSVSVSPSQIAASGETATVRVIALRANGTPVTPGTEVRLEPPLGTITPIVEVDDTGSAMGELIGDGRVGMATVTARSGAAEAATVEVEIGKFPANINLQATPSQVLASGGVVQLLAIVRDDQGQPLRGAQVNFSTDVGTLRSGGSLVATNGRGEATDRLTVSQLDLEAVTAPSFNVSATVGGGGVQTDTATIRIASAAPIIDFVPRNAGENRVFFDNLTQGSEPITFAWDFQNDGTIDSMERSPTFNYGSQGGTFTVVLTATNEFGSDVEIRTITVPVAAG